MLEYIMEVKRGLRDQHGFTPLEGSSDDDPCFNNIPNGEYPMTINGRVDSVVVVDGKLNVGNFDE